jgi:hypothetical protein
LVEVSFFIFLFKESRRQSFLCVACPLPQAPHARRPQGNSHFILFKKRIQIIKRCQHLTVLQTPLAWYKAPQARRPQGTQFILFKKTHLNHNALSAPHDLQTPLAWYKAPQARRPQGTKILNK